MDDIHSNESEGHDNTDIVSLSSTESEIESDSDDENELKKLIPFIKKKLQDKILLPEQKWRLEAVLQYCQCYQLNIKKMEASLFVAQQLRKNKYSAHQL